MSSALSFCPQRALTCVSVRVTDRQTDRQPGGVETGRWFQPSVRDWDAPSSPEGALLFQSRRIEGFSESPDNLAAAASKDVHAQVSVLIAWVCIHHSWERKLQEISLSSSLLKAGVVFVTPPPPILFCHGIFVYRCMLLGNGSV